MKKTNLIRLWSKHRSTANSLSSMDMKIKDLEESFTHMKSDLHYFDELFSSMKHYLKNGGDYSVVSRNPKFLCRLNMAGIDLLEMKEKGDSKYLGAFVDMKMKEHCHEETFYEMLEEAIDKIFKCESLFSMKLKRSIELKYFEYDPESYWRFFSGRAA
jgi:hypothetical protein